MTMVLVVVGMIVIITTCRCMGTMIGDDISNDNVDANVDDSDYTPY